VVLAPTLLLNVLLKSVCNPVIQAPMPL